ncbi:hypothetical protein Ahy_B04g070137 isoform B [Arachis hypogaea]|uniref:Uncharacterized protein n=1 Tax=Arachis hypogaea TaxID=3818 RepID=A0A444ZF33_ARAHY|nr:hypothetical protein Ahy_B04g070137 isoform B [Arachis hypogaea]
MATGTRTMLLQTPTMVRTLVTVTATTSPTTMVLALPLITVANSMDMAMVASSMVTLMPPQGTTAFNRPYMDLSFSSAPLSI